MAISLFLAAAVAATLPPLTDIRQIPVKAGITRVENFTPDGKAAEIVVGIFDNGNAHGHKVMMVLVPTGGRVRPPIPPTPILVPIDGRGDTIADQPFDGEAEVALNRLFRATLHGKPAVFLAEARRKPDTVLTDPAPTTITLWRLDRNPIEIGPRYSFAKVAEFSTAGPYCSAEAALVHEVGVPHPEGWDGFTEPDGCPATQGAGLRSAQDALIAGRDLTSFPNATGRRRQPGKGRLADYGFMQISRFDDGMIEATLADGSWRMSVRVLTYAAQAMTVCITDIARDSRQGTGMQPAAMMHHGRMAGALLAESYTVQDFRGLEKAGRGRRKEGGSAAKSCTVQDNVAPKQLPWPAPASDTPLAEPL